MDDLAGSPWSAPGDSCRIHTVAAEPRPDGVGSSRTAPRRV